MSTQNLCRYIIVLGGESKAIIHCRDIPHAMQTIRWNSWDILQRYCDEDTDSTECYLVSAPAPLGEGYQRATPFREFELAGEIDMWRRWKKNNKRNKKPEPLVPFYLWVTKRCSTTNETTTTREGVIYAPCLSRALSILREDNYKALNNISEFLDGEIEDLYFSYLLPLEDKHFTLVDINNYRKYDLTLEVEQWRSI